MAEFLLYALLAGLCIAAIAGPLGCFVVWRRMSYFGETLAHSALLGVAFAILLDINLQFSVIGGCVAIALLLSIMERKKNLATDTLLGILAHSALALGLVLMSFADNVQIDLMGYLFGDLLAVSQADLIWVFATSIIVAFILTVFWPVLLAATVHEELAYVEGVAVAKLQLLLMLLIAILVAVAMKIIGVLLITSLMIIPPASARCFASTPEQMAFSASSMGMLAVCLGLFASYQWDTPTGPTIVVAAAIIFIICNLIAKLVPH